MTPLHRPGRAGGSGVSPIGDTDEYAQWDAAYVLGSLAHCARREYESHLSACPSCRESVSELAGMPALLGMLTRDDVEALDESAPPVPQPHVLTSLLVEVRRRRFRSRLTGAGATVAAVVLLLGVLVSANSDHAIPTAVPPGASASALTMARVLPTSLSATITLSRHAWGTRIEMTCTYGVQRGNSEENTDHADDTLAMVVVGRDGHSTRVATWLALHGVTATPNATTSLSIDDIAAVQVISADNGAVLLQRSL
jgi:hypothetical protein